MKPRLKPLVYTEMLGLMDQRVISSCADEWTPFFLEIQRATSPPNNSTTRLNFTRLYILILFQHVVKSDSQIWISETVIILSKGNNFDLTSKANTLRMYRILRFIPRCLFTQGFFPSHLNLSQFEASFPRNAASKIHCTIFSLQFYQGWIFLT